MEVMVSSKELLKPLETVCNLPPLSPLPRSVGLSRRLLKCVGTFSEESDSLTAFPLYLLSLQIDFARAAPYLPASGSILIFVGLVCAAWNWGFCYGFCNAFGPFLIAGEDGYWFAASCASRLQHGLQSNVFDWSRGRCLPGV